MDINTIDLGHMGHQILVLVQKLRVFLPKDLKSLLFYNRINSPGRSHGIPLYLLVDSFEVYPCPPPTQAPTPITINSKGCSVT